MINVNNVSKSYKMYNKPIDRMKEALSISRKQYHSDFWALKDISFQVKKGENIGIVGTNGSGKSTLLKMITGVLTPTSGNVEVYGKISALLELGAGFNMEYTGIENIYLNGTMMGYTREDMDEKIQGILDFADIGDFVYQPVKTYSSGMFARLAFAVAINVEPDILIVDEALSVGDNRFQIKCMDRMKQMMDGGVTILFVTHDTNAIRRFCSKAIWIERGKMMHYGEVNSVADAYIDFLKTGEVVCKPTNVNKINIPEFKPSKAIAEVVDFSIYNTHGEKISESRYDEYIRVEIIYDVNDTKLDAPVLGIALLSVDGDYMCGLNTLLDRVKIPWNYGRNIMSLEYTNGIRAIGGKYFFNVAIFEKTATIPIWNRAEICEFQVYSEYVGEGKYIIPHEWRIING